MLYTLKRDNMPLLSQWIKKYCRKRNLFCSIFWWPVRGLSLRSKKMQAFSEPRWVRPTETHSKRAHLVVCSFAGDPYGTRTHVTTVKGWCLNRLTNGPLIFTMLVYHLLQILSMNFLSLSQNISKYLQKISFSSPITPLFDTVFRIQRVPAPSILQNRELRVKTWNEFLFSQIGKLVV